MGGGSARMWQRFELTYIGWYMEGEHTYHSTKYNRKRGTQSGDIATHQGLPCKNARCDWCGGGS